MCKDANINMTIKKLDFSSIRGKFKAYLSDGRELVIPLSFFPDIKKLPKKKKREDWMVLDGQYFTFSNLSKVYSISDLFAM